MTYQRTRISSRVVIGILAGVAVAVGLAAVVTQSHHSATTATPAAPTASAAPTPGTTSPAQHAGGPTGPAAPAGWTLIATVTHDTARYPRPGAAPDGVVPDRWYGAASALPVVAEQPGWLDVRLPTRPNGSTAWIPQAAAAVTATPYEIIISLATRHLELLKDGKIVMSAPAGVGTAGDPTPVGHYFTAFFEHSPGPAWGPFILVTSAHSNSITDWEGSGDAVIGIHGPLGDYIGPDGAAISHGCIRVPVPDLTQLRKVPAGTPITITA